MKCVNAQVKFCAYAQVRNQACNRVGEQVSDQTYDGVCDRAEAQVKV